MIRTVEIIGAALVTAILTFLVVSPIAYKKGDAAGYARYRMEQQTANYEAELERMRDNETLGELTVYDICADDMRSRGLSIDGCEPLRGL